MLSLSNAFSEEEIIEFVDRVRRFLGLKPSETIEFTAGPEKGEYPYVCTFPGHSRIMQGTLFVE